MKVRPKIPGESPFQANAKPSGEFKETRQVGITALRNAFYRAIEFASEKKVPNKKLADRTTKAAFRVFAKDNKPIS